MGYSSDELDAMLAEAKAFRQSRQPIRFKMSYRDRRTGRVKWLAVHGTYKSVEDAAYHGKGILAAAGDHFEEGAVFQGRRLVRRVERHD